MSFAETFLFLLVVVARTAIHYAIQNPLIFVAFFLLLSSPLFVKMAREKEEGEIRASEWRLGLRRRS